MRDRFECFGRVAAGVFLVLGVSIGFADGELDALLKTMLQRNDAVRAAYERYVSLSRKVGFRSALPDPVFSLGWYLQEVETRVGPQRARVGIVQRFPWFGTLSLRKRIALLEARAAYEEYRRVVDERAGRLKKAYYRWCYLGESERVVKEIVAVLESSLEIARKGYGGGKGSQEAVIKLGVELERLKDRLESIRVRRRIVEDRIRYLAGVKGKGSLRLRGSMPSLPSVSGVKHWLALAADHSPFVKKARVLAEAAALRKQLVAKEDKPRFSVGLTYIDTSSTGRPSVADDGKDPLILTVGVSIPLWREKYRSARGSAAAAEEGMQRRLEDVRLRVKTDILDAFNEYEDALRRVRLYLRTLVPRARAVLELYNKRLAGGEGGVIDVLDAERTLLEFEISLAAARRDALSALAAMETVSGKVSFSLGKEVIPGREKNERFSVEARSMNKEVER